MIHSQLISPQEWLQKIATSFDAPIVENRVAVNPVRGKGYVELHAIEPGFDLMLTDIVLRNDFTFYRAKSTYQSMMIKCLVETPAAVSFVNTNDEKNVVAQEGIFVATPDYPETTHIKAGCCYKILVISLSFDWIKNHHQDPSFILNAVATENSIFAYEKANPTIQRLALNIFALSNADLCYKNLIIKASAIELLVKICNLFDYRKNIPLKSVIKNQEDVNLLFRVRKRLAECLETGYPTIAALSGEFGISPTKLKTNFSIFFGKPVFQYFQEERMDFARKLIESGTHQISEVGFRIGYSNLSKFTAAYKKQFGFNPKDTGKIEKKSVRDKI